MKKLIAITLVYLAIGTSVSAKHIISGTMGYECLGGGDYEFTMIIFRDCAGGGADYDQIAPIAVYVNNTQFLLLDVPFESREEINPAPYEDCPSNFDNYCVEKGTYKFTIYLPLSTTDTYTVVYQRCCWSHSVANLENPGENGITIKTDITPASQAVCNSYAVVDYPLAFAACPSVPVSLPFTQTDSEGDSLVYEFCFPLNGGGLAGSPGNPGDPTLCDGVAPNPPCSPPYEEVPPAEGFGPDYPFPNTSGITFNPDTEMIEFTPDLVGKFIYSLCVLEYRNGDLLGSYRQNFQLSVKETITAIQELHHHKQRWSLGSNLVDDEILIHSEENISQANFYIYNTEGKLCMSKIKCQSSNFLVSTNTLSPGMHFIVIQEGKHREVHKVIIGR